MVIQEKKNGKARRTVDVSYLSKHGLNESQHTPSAPSSPSVSLATSTSLPWTALTGNTSSPLQRRTDTRQPLPQNGANSTTGELPKDTYHQGTATAGTRTPSWKTVHEPPPSRTSRRLWTTSSHGLTQLRWLSKVYSAFSPTATQMAWFSTPRSSGLPGGRWSSVESSLPPSTLLLLETSQPHATSRK